MCHESRRFVGIVEFFDAGYLEAPQALLQPGESPLEACEGYPLFRGQVHHSLELRTDFQPLIVTGKLLILFLEPGYFSSYSAAADAFRICEQEGVGVEGAAETADQQSLAVFQAVPEHPAGVLPIHRGVVGV